MTIRLCFAVIALAAVLGACAVMPAPAPTPATSAQLNTPPNADGAMGKYIEDVMAVNGPPSQLWDLPDGRRAYQWQQSSVTARVRPRATTRSTRTRPTRAAGPWSAPTRRLRAA